jgi:ubiquitin C-terminal hydrolase
MLQCLSNSEVLTLKFIKDDSYKLDINYDNPLGHGGKIASAYAQLLTDMWSGDFSVVSPSQFKGVIGDFAPQFSGYQQQDSQELMSCLLDGLHEDLNRVLKKPYVETVDSNGRPDDVVSAEAWSRHLLRNDSVVNDCCFGLMKSHITCVNCGHTSVTFDPFSSLSLPVPVNTLRLIKLVLYTLPLGKQETISVTIDYGKSVRDLKVAILAEHAGLLGGRGSILHLCQLTKSGSGANGGASIYGRLSKTLEDCKSIKDVFKSSYDYVVAYELPPEAEVTESENTSRYASLDGPTLASGTVTVLFGARVQSYLNMGSSRLTVAMTNSPRRLYFTCDATMASVYARVYDIIKAGMSLEDVDSGPDKGFPFELCKSSNSLGSMHVNAFIPSDDSPVDFDSDSTMICVWSDGVSAKMDVIEVGSYSDQLQLPESKASISLQDCLDKFSESEQLAAEETFFCSKCKQHLAPVKKMDVWATPDILIIHLKRFQYSKGMWSVQREKISELINFPIEDLDLRPYVKGPISDTAPPIYDLYAVSEHSGGLGGGHYTAKGLNFVDKQWYDFNDSSVSLVSSSSCVTPQAYVLFYKRKIGSLLWAGMSTSAAIVDSHDMETS